MKYLKKLAMVILVSLTMLILLACSEKEIKALEDKHKETASKLVRMSNTDNSRQISEFKKSEFPDLFTELSNINADQSIYVFHLDNNNNKSTLSANGESYKVRPDLSLPRSVSKLHGIESISILKFKDQNLTCHLINIAGTQKTICEKSGNSSVNPLGIPDVPENFGKEFRRFVKAKHNNDYKDIDEAKINIDMLIIVDPTSKDNKIRFLKSKDYDSRDNPNLSGIEVHSLLSANYVFFEINPTCTWQDQNGTPVLYCSK